MERLTLSFNGTGSLTVGAADNPLLVTYYTATDSALKVKTSGTHTEPGTNKYGVYSLLVITISAANGQA